MIVSRLSIATVALVLAACGPHGESSAANTEGAATPIETLVTAPTAMATADPVANDGDAAAASANAADPTIDTSNQTGAKILRQILVKAGTIDGKPITGFEIANRCDANVRTAAGTTAIDWRKVGNFAGRDAGARYVIDIDDGNGRHAIAVPRGKQPEPLGNASARLESGFSVLADTCQS